jgi:hypothetical protein
MTLCSVRLAADARLHSHTAFVLPNRPVLDGTSPRHRKRTGVFGVTRGNRETDGHTGRMVAKVKASVMRTASANARFGVDRLGPAAGGTKGSSEARTK